jgi:hypothetical protein
MLEKYWVIFLGVRNKSEFFTLKLVGISFLIRKFLPYAQFHQTNYIRKSRDGCNGIYTKKLSKYIFQ